MDHPVGTLGGPHKFWVVWHKKNDKKYAYLDNHTSIMAASSWTMGCGHLQKKFLGCQLDQYLVISGSPNHFIGRIWQTLSCSTGIFLHFLWFFSMRWCYVCSWNPYSWKTRTCLSQVISMWLLKTGWYKEPGHKQPCLDSVFQEYSSCSNWKVNLLWTEHNGWLFGEKNLECNIFSHWLRPCCVLDRKLVQKDSDAMMHFVLISIG